MQRYRKGSFTIEITILMPFILTIIIIISFFTLYVYNRNIMKNAVERGVRQCFYYENESNEEIQKACEDVILADLEQHMVGVDEVELEVMVTVNKVKVIITGKLDVPEVIELENISTEGIWGYDIRAEENRVNPAEILRDGKQIRDIFQKIGEGNEKNGN